MKALEAISALILLILGILTILAIVGLTMGQWLPARVGTSLETATKLTCQKVNPALCKTGVDPNIPHLNMNAARMPVFDFDANKNGTVNEHHPESFVGGAWITSYLDDNLESLCHFYYGCRIEICAGPHSSAECDADWSEWTDCCLVKVCGCPNY